MTKRTLFALDFDGVICHSAIETANTSWLAAQTYWSDMQAEKLTQSRIEEFVAIRPCLEYGYEAPLIMRLLHQQTGLDTDCNNYHTQIQTLIAENDFNIDELQRLFGQIRDELIRQDEASWLARNPLYDGVADALKSLDPLDWVIVTTKQERFVTKTLEANGIKLSADRLFGLEKKLSKQTILQNLKQTYPERPITFIEDRLPTLLGVQKNPELQSVKLQLVDWGYNTAKERQIANQHGIEVIALNEFTAGF